MNKPNPKSILNLKTGVFLLVLLQGLGAVRDASASEIYWTENVVTQYCNIGARSGYIYRASRDASQIENIFTDSEECIGGIKLDLVSSKMYWITNNIGIHRANLDGSGVELIFGGWVEGIALDVGAGKIYWSNGCSDPRIQRANLDGSSVEVLVPYPPAGYCVASVELDLINGKIYWTEDFVGSFGRANLDGSAAEILLPDQVGGSLALDVGAGKIYWANYGVSGVWTANLDGTDPENLIPVGVGGIEIDESQWKIYWTEGSKIRRANLDASNMEDVMVRPGRPSALALVPPEICDDGIDNDGDGSIDAADSDCFELDFPLRNQSACTAEINSVFDHSMTPGSEYVWDNTVTAYTGETGERSFGVCPVVGVCDDGYQQDFAGTFFDVNGNYTAAGYGQQYLFYDGHPAIDYRDPKHTSCGSDIIAAHGGDLIVPISDSVNGGSPTPWSSYHTFKIVHDSEWSTWYLHSSGMAPPFDSLTPSIECTSDLEAGDICLGKVEQGDHVAFVGSQGAPCHLHFEARNSDDAPVDPYGWLPDSVTNPDPYAIKSYDLWKRHGARTSVSKSCPSSAPVVANETDVHHVLGGSGVPGGVDVSLNEPVSGTFDADFFPTEPEDAAAIVNDPGSLTFALPTFPIQAWELTFDQSLTSTATITLGYDDSNLSLGFDETNLYVYHYVAPFGGCQVAIDCEWIQTAVVDRDTDQNTITFITDSFSQFVLGGDQVVSTPISFSGTAVGGTIEITVGAVFLQLVTVSGQTAQHVAAAVAAAINGDSTLAAAGVTAGSAGTTVSTNGSITSLNISDAGLYASSVNVPSMTLSGLIVLAGLMTLTALRRKS